MEPRDDRTINTGKHDQIVSIKKSVHPNHIKKGGTCGKNIHPEWYGDSFGLSLETLKSPSRV